MIEELETRIEKERRKFDDEKAKLTKKYYQDCTKLWESYCKKIKAMAPVRIK